MINGQQTFSNEAKNVMMKAVQAKQHGGGTEAQVALATAITTGESNVEVLCALIEDARG
tara:strand:- start:763 stop:939 length:177 start_codon:yes stop_codon:yes gene_type:complete